MVSYQETFIVGSEGCKLQAYVSQQANHLQTGVDLLYLKITSPERTGCKGCKQRMEEAVFLNADPNRLGVVIFHPYAHLGGCCDDPIVLSIFRSDLLPMYIDN